VPGVRVAFLGHVEQLQEGDVAVLSSRRSRDVASATVSLRSIDLFRGRDEVRRAIVDADKEILRLLCEGLGLRPNFLEEDISSSDAVLHVNLYPPCPASSSPAPGLACCRTATATTYPCSYSAWRSHPVLT
jgi:hypothetical protein